MSKEIQRFLKILRVVLLLLGVIGTLTVVLLVFVERDHSLNSSKVRLFLHCKVDGLASSPAFSSDGRLMGFGIWDGRVEIWDITRKSLYRSLATTKAPTISFSPDGRKVAVYGDQVELWALESGKLLHRLTGHNGMVMRACFSHDGRLVAANCGDCKIRVWDVNTGKLVRIFRPQYRRQENLIAISPEGQLIVIASVRGIAVEVWELGNGRKVYQKTFPSVGRGAFAISPDGRFWAVGLAGNKNRIRRIETRRVSNGELVRRLTVDEPVGLLTFSTDGRFLLNMGDRTRIWRVATGQQVGELDFSSASVVAISSDGRWLARALLGVPPPGGKPGPAWIDLWDVHSGQWVCVLEKNVRWGEPAFSPDGHYLASAFEPTIATLTKQSEVKVWRIQ